MSSEENHCGETESTDKRRRCDVLLKKIKRLPFLTWTTILKIGKDDPRRAIHSVKVGISLTLVSLLYLLEPSFKGIGQNAMWAVMTVVVVLEFTAGATLCKGLNRGLGTLSAGLLAFLIEYIATESGKILRAIFIGIAVFVIGTAATYVRFIPYIKRNFDYGVLIFLLTFNLITVSSYRVNSVLKIARERLYTIAIGCGICLLMSLFIFPIWSGEDLHKSTVAKLEVLARSIEACVNEYFSDDDSDKSDDKVLEDPVYKRYKAVLDSKSMDEALALYASWEPRRSRRCHKFPWQQYVKVGDVIRHFGYAVIALHGCLQTEIQTPRHVRALFKDPCTRLAGEVTKALLELADSIRKRRHCSPQILSDNLQQTLQDLDAAFKAQPKLFLGPNANRHAMWASHAASGYNSSGKSLEGPSPRVKTDASAALLAKRAIEQSPKAERKKVLRPTLSKIAITSLEFSEALPFAAFASLLVEAVARLDLVIEQVEELGRVANFKEFIPGDEVIVNCERDNNVENATNLSNYLHSHGAE